MFSAPPVNSFDHYQRYIGAYAWRPGAIGADRGLWIKANVHLMWKGRVKQDRPHLSRYNGEWMCHCAASCAFGKTPREAYAAHAKMEQMYSAGDSFRTITALDKCGAREDFTTPNFFKQLTPVHLRRSK